MSASVNKRAHTHTPHVFVYVLFWFCHNHFFLCIFSFVLVFCLFNYNFRVSLLFHASFGCHVTNFHCSLFAIILSYIFYYFEYGAKSVKLIQRIFSLITFYMFFNIMSINVTISLFFFSLFRCIQSKYNSRLI